MIRRNLIEKKVVIHVPIHMLGWVKQFDILVFLVSNPIFYFRLQLTYFFGCQTGDLPKSYGFPGLSDVVDLHENCNELAIRIQIFHVDFLLEDFAWVKSKWSQLR